MLALHVQARAINRYYVKRNLEFSRRMTRETGGFFLDFREAARESLLQPIVKRFREGTFISRHVYFYSTLIIYYFLF